MNLTSPTHFATSQDIYATLTTSPTMSDPTISINNLTFTFPDTTTGLSNISLDLPAGSRTLLIGGKNPLSFIP